MERVLCLACIFFFLSTSPVLGASLTLSSSQASLTAADEYSVHVALSIGSPDGTQYFLRGVFYASSGAYCGYTWNGSSWYNGPYTVNNGWQQLLAIPIAAESWAGQLKAKIDTSDANCQTNGTYHFKVERYTASGNGSFDTQNDLTVNITVPTPTFTPVPTPKPTRVPTTIPPTRMPTPAPSETYGATPVSADEGFVKGDIDYQPGSVSAEASSEEELTATITRVPTKILVKGDQKPKSTSFGILFIIGGGLCLIGCGILFFLRWRKEI